MQEFKIGYTVRIVSPNPNETIYVEDYDTDTFEIVSKHKSLDKYFLKNIQEDTYLECEYKGAELKGVN